MDRAEAAGSSSQRDRQRECDNPSGQGSECPMRCARSLTTRTRSQGARWRQSRAQASAAVGAVLLTRRSRSRRKRCAVQSRQAWRLDILLAASAWRPLDARTRDSTKQRVYQSKTIHIWRKHSWCGSRAHSDARTKLDKGHRWGDSGRTQPTIYRTRCSITTHHNQQQLRKKLQDGPQFCRRVSRFRTFAVCGGTKYMVDRRTVAHRI